LSRYIKITENKIENIYESCVLFRKLDVVPNTTMTFTQDKYKN